MKKIFVVLFAIVSSYLSSQNTNSTCANAAPFCANGSSGLTFPAVTSTPASAAQVGPSYGCLSSQPNPSWYYLQISTPGTLDILIQGTLTTSPTGPGQDVDFICWGPFSSLAGICNSLTVGNTIDCSYSGSYTETLNIPNGLAGEYYLVLITNFANVQQNILFQQYAGTGSTNCGLLANNSVICAGSNATVLASNSGNLGNPSYSIQPGGLTNSTGTFIVNPVTTTNYTVFVTGTNNLNATVTQTAVSSVTVNPQPSAVPTTTQSTCTSTLSAFNLGLTFNPPTPVPSYTINWSPVPGGVSNPTQVASSGAIAGGLYTATITANGGCATVASFSINPQPAIPVFTITPFGNTFTVTCAQPTVVLTTSDPNYNYTWNGPTAPQTGVTGQFDINSLGTWSVTATDQISNCTKVHTFTVSQNTSVPTLTVGPLFQTITCSLSAVTTVTATSNPTLNIQHDILSPFGGSFTANSYTAVYAPSAPGTYTSILTNMINGCKAQKTFTVASGGGFPTFTVTSPSIPGVAGIAGNFTLGCGTHSVININIVNAQTTNSLGIGNGGVASCTLIPPLTTTYSTSVGATSYTAAIPGTWTVIAKDPTSGCETKVPISVIQNTFGPQIEVTQLTTTLTCFTPTVQLQGLSTNTTVTFNWQTPSGNQAGGNLSVFGNGVPSNSTVATYILTGTDPNNTCKSTTAIPVYQNMFQPSVAIAANTKTLTCITSSVTLSNNSKVTSPSNFPTSNVVQGILWQGPPPQDDLQLSSSYVAGIAGIYTLTGKDETNGCIGQGTFEVIDGKFFPVVNNPIAPSDFFLDCGNKNVKIWVNVTDRSDLKITGSWISVGTSTLSEKIDSAFVTVPGEYKVTITNTVNGCATSASAKVVTGTLTSKFVPDVITGYAPLTVNFNNTSASSSSTTPSSSITTVWNFGNGTSSVTPASSVTPTTIYNQPGTYTVVAYSSKGACQSTYLKTIVVDIPSKLEVPNVFTPNDDGSNDLFFVRSANLSEISALIYDRWGHKIYEITSSTGNIAWDGKNQVGKEVAEGTYFYIITAKGKDGKDYDTKGTVNLYR
jgi:gliding motility-associated-like protein